LPHRRNPGIDSAVCRRASAKMNFKPSRPRDEWVKSTIAERRSRHWEALSLDRASPWQRAPRGREKPGRGTTGFPPRKRESSY
ncbi:MAG: hypothetical protein ACREQ5_12885, partial [Candidatus Dormibacteria bacterium]